MSSDVARKMLVLSDKLEDGYIAPTKAIISYLELQDGPTDSLVFACVMEQRISDSVAIYFSTINKVIEVVYSVLKKGDFKVGQLPLQGELLFKCSSARDANKLHHVVKVCAKTVIGFRKLVHVHVIPEVANIVSKKIRDANPDEYKLTKEIGYYTKEMKKVLGKHDSEAAGHQDHAGRKILDLSHKFENGNVAPTTALISYLGLKKGPTDTILFAPFSTQRSSEAIMNKIIEVVHSVLEHGDFKVGQLHSLGEFLVKWSTPEDANKLHQKVKVCANTVIGFRKLQYVDVTPVLALLVAKNICDANPDEYKLNKDDAEAGSSKENAEAGGSTDDAEADSSKEHAEADRSTDDAEQGASKKRKL